MTDLRGAWGAGRFEDERLAKRGLVLLQRMVQEQSTVVARLSDGRAEVVGFGRFLHNERVTVAEVFAAAAAELAPLVAGREVLAIQDTSELVYGKRSGKRRGMGPVAHGGSRGMLLHPVLVLDVESSAVLGLAHGEVWTRTRRARRNYQALPIEKKESYRWLRSGLAAKAALPGASRITLIADRESDIYEAWCRLPDQRCRLVARVARNRRLADGRKLFAVAAGWAPAGRVGLELPAAPGREARTAKLALRFGPVEIKRPKNCSDRRAPRSQRLYLVEAREDKPPAGTAPLHWRLLVSHPITSFKQACDLIGLYRQRWHIEQLFRTMKRQGLKIEDSQIDSLHALENLIALATVAATQVMQLVNAREGSPRPATDVIDADEIATVARIGQRLEGKTQAQKNPHPEASLAWLSWIVARLGGWTGYVSERLPGPITMHNGLRRLRAILDSRQFYEDDL